MYIFSSSLNNKDEEVHQSEEDAEDSFECLEARLKTPVRITTTHRCSVLHNHNLIFFRPQNPDPQFWTSKFNHWLDPRENLDLDVISVIISSSDFFYERSWQETVFIHCFCVNIFLYITCLSQIKKNIYAFLNVIFFSILGFEMILSKIRHQTAHLLRRQL